MIPKVKNYEGSAVSGAKTRFETEEMMQKKFGVTRTMWKRDEPDSSYFVFEYRPEKGPAQIYKIGIPFIEKKHGRYGEIQYDETRSYRFFFHIFKAYMMNTEIGMEFSQIFSNFLVIGKTPDGTPISVQDKVLEAQVNGKIPALGFDGM